MKKASSVVASDVYPLIHALLASSGMKASAAALHKEAKLVCRCCDERHWVSLWSLRVAHFFCCLVCFGRT